MSTPPRNLAVLFADVSGSTSIYEQLGDIEALAVIERCLEVVREVCPRFGGRVIKSVGDDVMAAFPDADSAADAACEMQSRVALARPHRTIPVCIHIGFVIGAAIEDGGDLYGDSVNTAARMTDLAKASQILTSAETVAALSPRLRTRVRDHDAFTFQGKQKDVGTYELIWQESEDELTAVTTRVLAAPARLRLRYGGRDIELNEANPNLTLGRDNQNDVVITDRKASRVHARIERRRDKFVLIDLSSNGTFITGPDEQEVALRREAMVLRGKGRLCFGHASDEDTSDYVVFDCGDTGFPGGS